MTRFERTQGPTLGAEHPVDLAMLSLDDLAYLPASALEELYPRCRTPRLGDLEGPMRGLFLAFSFEPESFRKPLAAIARSSLFPWQGKTFQGASGGEGEGVNLLFSSRNPTHYFYFYTRLRTSRVGEFSVVELDYDHPKNPRFFRGVRDELRQLNEQVFLGRWYINLVGRELLIGFFGMERRPN